MTGTPGLSSPVAVRFFDHFLKRDFLSQHFGVLLSFGLLFVATIRPQTGTRIFSAIENSGCRLAERKVLSIFVIAMSAILIRLIMLPAASVPVPSLHDEFSHLLLGDTLAHGRLSNPPHPMWVYFDTFHVNQHPRYMAIYPPAQGAVLALGQILGHPWIGVLLSVAAMCAAVVWGLRGWLPPQWAFLGGVMVMLRLGVSDYWVNSYWGGAVAATGGALVIGALYRIIHFQRPREGAILGIGCSILANSRPFEGLIFCMPVFVALILWLKKTNNGSKGTRFRLVGQFSAVVAVCIIFMLYYNARGTGNPLLFPYVLNVTRHFAIPQTIFERPQPPFQFQNPQFSAYYNVWWSGTAWPHGRPDTFGNVAVTTLSNVRHLLRFLVWPEFSVALLAAPWVACDRRTRFFIIQTIICFGGFLLVAFFQVHYAAPLMVSVFALLTQCLRHLRKWDYRNYRIGIGISRAVVLSAILLSPFHQSFYKTFDLSSRARIAAGLSNMPGKHLVIVHYAPTHNVLQEWVYNAANIDGAKVVWVRDIPGVDLSPVLSYFHGRRVWIVDADDPVPEPRPYLR